MRRLPPLRALEAFVRVVRLGSAKAAAVELGLSPSALSRRVQALEENGRNARQITADVAAVMIRLTILCLICKTFHLLGVCFALLRADKITVRAAECNLDAGIFSDK